ncbi:hypothetical protein ACH0B5_05810 [Ureibacillus sp. 179-F W5.1 NHS]|uniref:Uncharacterized protein n=1 Tax=Lysinibacillus halotolerans TaxID=1368476 RepID=A0A3M8H602_9BACI|nr:hypothetical protein [Lysinibacillus halotolerans]RNC97520.1 hypothetical protein EC501_14870 [Lysinibacillus halotolerans]
MEYLFIAISIVIIIYRIMKNRGTLKVLTKRQILGVGISYLLATLMGFIFIYFGGNWIVGSISNIIFKYIVFLAFVLIILNLCVTILNKLLLKITNGILPKE